MPSFYVASHSGKPLASMHDGSNKFDSVSEGNAVSSGGLGLQKGFFQKGDSSKAIVGYWSSVH